MKTRSLSFPNSNYEQVLTKVVDYFEKYPSVYAIALTGSMARGKAVEGSCIDLFIFLSTKHLKRLASTINNRVRAYSRMGGRVCYYEGDVEGGVEFGNVRVDLGFTDGVFNCEHENSFDITRDDLEPTVGNLLCYSVVLYERGKQFQRLRQKYLPFYNDVLREIRLAGTAEEFDYKTWKAKWLAERGEYFAALDALLEAQRISLQHLFIKERKYPIDYVKWVKEECSRILRMPHLYRDLVQTLDGLRLTKKSFLEKSHLLEELFTRYGIRSFKSAK